MKYSKRKDKYCCNVLNDNFHEIDDRLNNLENGGGGSGGGGSCECNIVYLTQEEYDALPPSKESDDVEYRITNANTSINAARDWAYDNRISKLEATDVQSAIDEVQNNVSTVSERLGGKLLWENPSPNSDFGKQTIELSSSDYDYLKFYYFVDGSYACLGVQETLKGYGTKLINVSYSGSTAVSIMRNVTYISDTSYDIKGSTTNGTANNSLNVPYRIYGFKF